LSLFSIFEAKADFEILGLLFDISKTKANTFNWLDILRDILPASQMEEVRENRNKKIAQPDRIPVNSTEQPTARPVD